MKSNDIVLPISATSQFRIPLQYPLSTISMYCIAPIIFFHHNYQLPILQGHPLYFNMLHLRELLQNALNDELKLSNDITNDIGYISNTYSRRNSHYKNKIFFQCASWAFRDNQNEYSSWIYNKNGTIFFTITPVYPYYSNNGKYNPHYIPFKKWILNYKPYFTATLSRETAQEWLDQAEYIIKTIDNNEAYWKEEYMKQVSQK